MLWNKIQTTKFIIKSFSLCVIKIIDFHTNFKNVKNTRTYLIHKNMWDTQNRIFVIKGN